MKHSGEIILEDLKQLVGKLGINTTLILCAIAIRSLMGLDNWKKYMLSSINDSEFKKLFINN